jgi:hypothetical protein
MASIDDFASRLQGGGARANQFRVVMNAPAIAGSFGSQTEQTSFLVRTASLPGQTITEIPVNFRGRQLFVAGDRTFETWSTTVFNDTDFAIRKGIERWMNGINDLNNSRGRSNVNEYTADLFVDQLNRDNVVIKSYILKKCWPTVISPIELNMDTVSEIETFDITWRYTSFDTDF